MARRFRAWFVNELGHEFSKDFESGEEMERFIERAVKNGYPAERYLITKTVSETEWTDKMKFKGRTVTERAIQTYPKEAK